MKLYFKTSPHSLFVCLHMVVPLSREVICSFVIYFGVSYCIVVCRFPLDLFTFYAPLTFCVLIKITVKVIGYYLYQVNIVSQNSR